MAIYRVQGPDGAIHRFEGPDEATPEQVESFAAQQFGKQPSGNSGQSQSTKQSIPEGPDAYSQVNDEMSGTGKLVAGIGGGMYGAYLGAKDLAAKGLNKVGLVSDKTVSEIGNDVSGFKDAQSGLSQSGYGVTGNVIGTAAALAPSMLIPGASTYAGTALIGGVGSAVSTPGDMNERIKAGVMGAAGGVAGKAIGSKIGSIAADRSASKSAQLNAQMMQNAPKDALVKTAADAGLVVPPTQANPTVLNRALEGFSGKITTAQNASIKNQIVVNQLAKKALGLPEDSPITVEALNNLRKSAGVAYDEISKIQQPLSANAKFKNAIQDLGSRWKEASKEFPDIVKNSDIDTLVGNLNKDNISPSAAVEVIKKLRFDAKANLKSAEDPAKLALGKAQSKAAETVENLIEDNLQSTKYRFELAKTARQSGVPYKDTRELLDSLKESRKLIAKSYDVEAALNETTGNVSAKHLAKLVEKGKPLTGELKLAGEFSRAFPKATQNVEAIGSTPGVSPLDYAAALITSGASGGNPLSLASLLARPAVRSTILSGPYQQRMLTPNYNQGRLSSMVNTSLNSDKDQNLIRLLSIGAGSRYSEEK